MEHRKTSPRDAPSLSYLKSSLRSACCDDNAPRWGFENVAAAENGTEQLLFRRSTHKTKANVLSLNYQVFYRIGTFCAQICGNGIWHTVFAKIALWTARSPRGRINDATHTCSRTTIVWWHPRRDVALLPPPATCPPLPKEPVRFSGETKNRQYLVYLSFGQASEARLILSFVLPLPGLPFKHFHRSMSPLYSLSRCCHIIV